ncbi:MAG: hypothetical protein LBN39_10175 [Planctomycetaceae bacterium]|nr:hypothetical protein [Planctomycetaceae bacterium]
MTVPQTYKTESGLFHLTLNSYLSFTVGFHDWTFRITPLRLLMLLTAAAAGCIMLVRFVVGLHPPITNLNDEYPWGLWKGWAVFAGVALAGGGYGTAFLVHILHIKKLEPFARRTLLTSLLGYILLLLGLFLEIGRWWNFWRPFVDWGHASPLFEVFWCVTIYTIIQCLELAEIITEKVFKFLHCIFTFIFPAVVICGVMVPSMHQSTLGAIYLLMEGRLTPLWWSPIIFLFFLLSSLMVGPAMAMLESAIAYFTYGHKTPLPSMRLLARIGGGIMLVYLVLRLGDLYLRGQIPVLADAAQHLFTPDNIEGQICLGEIALGVLLPILIVFSPLGSTYIGLVLFGIFGTAGVFINRMDVVVVGMVHDSGYWYFPTVMEWIVCFGFASIGLLAYLFLVENFNILNEPEHHG